VLITLIDLYEKQGRYRESISAGHRILATLTGDEARQHPSALALAHVAIGVSLLRLGSYREAEKPLLQALAVVETAWGRDDPRAAEPLDALGMAYMALGRWDDAEKSLQRALTILTSRRDSSQLLLALTLKDLGGLYVARGDFAKAEHPPPPGGESAGYAVLNQHPVATVAIFNTLAFTYGSMGQKVRRKSLSAGPGSP
jgi:tetratricopeptide (TPR) repeat protein